MDSSRPATAFDPPTPPIVALRSAKGHQALPIVALRSAKGHQALPIVALRSGKGIRHYPLSPFAPEGHMRYPLSPFAPRRASVITHCRPSLREGASGIPPALVAEGARAEKPAPGLLKTCDLTNDDFPPRVFRQASPPLKGGARGGAFRRPRTESRSTAPLRLLFSNLLYANPALPDLGDTNPPNPPVEAETHRGYDGTLRHP